MKTTEYQKACKTLDRKPMQLSDFDRYPQEHQAAKFAEHRMETRTEAENFKANGNKPWIPKYGQDYIWRPWMYYKAGVGFSFSGTYFGDSVSVVGSRLGAKSKEIAVSLGQDKEYTSDFNKYMQR